MKISNIIISYAVNTVIADVKKRPGNACIVALSALPAIEMAIRSIGFLYEIACMTKDVESRSKKAGNLIGVVLLTPCALDAFRGARPLGAIGFIFYSIFLTDKDDRLITAHIVSKTLSYISRHKIQAALGPVQK